MPKDDGFAAVRAERYATEHPVPAQLVRFKKWELVRIEDTGQVFPGIMDAHPEICPDTSLLHLFALPYIDPAVGDVGLVVAHAVHPYPLVPDNIQDSEIVHFIVSTSQPKRAWAFCPCGLRPFRP